MKQHVLVTIWLLLAFPLSAMSAGFPWYAGVSGGASSLRPETQNSPFKLDSNVSIGGGAFVGYDFNKRFSFEAAYHFLGNATLTGANGKTEIGYTALSAGALMYLYGNANDVAERNGFMGFVRLGFSSMDNSASIPLEREDNVAVWAGVGVEWPFTEKLSLRGELNSFDGDAQSARLSVMYRPRTNLSRSPGARAPQRTQVERPIAPTVTPTPEIVAPAVKTPLPTIEKPRIEPVQPSTQIANSGCIAPAENEPVDAQGCGLFSGPLRGVEFASGTATLTQIGMQLLDRLSNDLLRNPAVIVEIQAHTESFGNVARAKDISRQRSLAVARHLAGRGVPVSRLRARAFGHTQPLTEDNTVGGRRQNNRIELRVLP